jgi:cytochrome c-type biogenesis protein CcmF
MLIGKLFLSGAVGALLLTLVLFKIRNARLMRIVFSASVFFLIASLAVLLVLLLGDYTAAAYVADNSSPHTPLLYKITALWAGQQGSWLFWTCLLAVCSLPRIFNGRRIVSLVLIFLILVFATLTLVFANPFTAAVSASTGHGYNPLLENFWMAIHPPLLFAGYSLFAILFAEAIASFVDKEPLRGGSIFERYLYASGGFMTLGIVTGAVWAYETLGWGGFWGWDPVENGSLVSWLFFAALLHYPGSGSKKTYGPVLVLLPFLSALFFTYLTRSGLLADLSVHSFGVSALALPLGLLFFVCGILPVALNLFYKRSNNKNNESREPISAAGQFIITYAGIICVAAIFPVILALFGMQVSAVRPEFFTMMSLILSSAMFGVMSYSYIRYRNKKRIIAASLIFILTMTYMVFRIPFNVWVALLSVTACASFSLSIVYLKTYFEKGIAHAGLALFVIGVLLSGASSVHVRLELPRDEKINAGVAHLEFKGVTSASSAQGFILEYTTRSAPQTYIFPFSITKEGSLSVQKTLVIHGFMHDIHLTPEGYDNGILEEKNRTVLKSKELLLVSIMIKPLMMLVWLGMCMIIAGLFVRAVRIKNRNTV